MEALVRSLFVQASLRLRREDGQTMTEYALVLALVAVACAGIITALMGGVNGAVTTITNALPG